MYMIMSLYLLSSLVFVEYLKENVVAIFGSLCGVKVGFSVRHTAFFLRKRCT